MNKVSSAQKKIERGAVAGYKAIENGVLNGYKKIEDKFVGAFLTDEKESEVMNDVRD